MQHITHMLSREDIDNVIIYCSISQYLCHYQNVRSILCTLKVSGIVHRHIKHMLSREDIHNVIIDRVISRYFCLFIAMEPRLLTRMDVHTFTRKAYELGVKYIGGCCGYEPYHIRASAEEVHI